MYWLLTQLAVLVPYTVHWAPCARSSRTQRAQALAEQREQLRRAEERASLEAERARLYAAEDRERFAAELAAERRRAEGAEQELVEVPPTANSFWRSSHTRFACEMAQHMHP